MNGLALCAGAGGLELGLRLALGPAYRTVGYVEREAFAAACLVARMEDQTLDRAPVWDDLETFDGRPWRDRVDLIAAGFPCQPASQAGQRLGTGDERWLWPHVARVVREVGPRLVFIENVPGLLSVNGGRAMREVLGDLADLGFDAEWTRLSAADIGATQLRERLWLLAHRHGSRLPQLRRQPEHDRDPRDDTDGPGSADVADTGCLSDQRWGASGDLPGPAGRAEGAARQQRDGNPAGDGREALADPEGQRGRTGLRQGRARVEAGRVAVAEPAHGRLALGNPPGEGHEGPVHRAPQRWQGPARPGEGLPLWPPGPDDTEAEVTRRDGPQPSVRRMADGLAHRLDRLHTIGNGVVPLVAASAFVHLARRAGLMEMNP